MNKHASNMWHLDLSHGLKEKHNDCSLKNSPPLGIRTALLFPKRREKLGDIARGVPLVGARSTVRKHR